MQATLILGGVLVALVAGIVWLAIRHGRIQEREAAQDATIKKEHKVQDAVDAAPVVVVDDDWLRNSPSSPAAGKADDKAPS